MENSILYWWHQPNAIEGKFDRTSQIKKEAEKNEHLKNLISSIKRNQIISAFI